MFRRFWPSSLLSSSSSLSAPSANDTNDHEAIKEATHDIKESPTNNDDAHHVSKLAAPVSTSPVATSSQPKATVTADDLPDFTIELDLDDDDGDMF